MFNIEEKISGLTTFQQNEDIKLSDVKFSFEMSEPFTPPPVSFGLQGPQGVSGTNGTNGRDGVQGFQGRQGVTGTIGTITVEEETFQNVQELILLSTDLSVVLTPTYESSSLTINIEADPVQSIGPQGRQGFQGPGGGDLDFGSIVTPVTFTLDMGPI